jgi:ribosomal protein S18 acetylase RimI-like enzyme
MTADDWQVVRDLRLAALQDSPGAFASTYAREAGRTEEEWRDWVGRCAFFAAGTDGIAACIVEQDGEHAGWGHLVSMWVAPTARRTGVGSALIEHVLAYAREQSYDGVLLWVADPNTGARALYERHGFAPTGETGPLPSDPSITEQVLALSLREVVTDR